jgi:hypothetical protein
VFRYPIPDRPGQRVTIVLFDAVTGEAFSDGPSYVLPAQPPAPDPFSVDGATACPPEP